MEKASPEAVRAGIELAAPETKSLSLERLTRALRSYGDSYNRPGRLDYKTREALYRQEPLLQRGIKKHTGDLVKHGFNVIDADGNIHEGDDVVQAWLRDTFAMSRVREALQSGHIHGDGYVEIEWDDAGEGKDPRQDGSMPVAIHVIDPATVRFMDGKDADGKTVCYLVQDNFGGNGVILHPDRYHHFFFTSLPGYKHAIPTIEAAYHSAISKVKGDQGIGEILYHSGTPKILATIKDGKQPDLEAVAKMLNDPDFARGYVYDERLSMTQLNPTPGNFTGFYDILKVSIAAAIGIPVMMLEGAQAGSLSGSETNLMDYNSDLHQGRVMVLEPFFTVIVAAFLKLEPSQFDFDWTQPDGDQGILARTARDQATAMSLLIGDGVKKDIAASIVGLDLTIDDFETPVPGTMPPIQPGAPGTTPPGTIPRVPSGTPLPASATTPAGSPGPKPEVTGKAPVAASKRRRRRLPQPY